MTVTHAALKRRINIVGGEQLQAGAVTYDKVESDLLERLESTTLKAKLNYLTFTNSNQGEIYLHGLINGQDADIDGHVFYNGLKITVPKGPVTTQYNGEGYLVYSTAQDFATRGITLYAGQSVIPAFLTGGSWYYDDNTTTPKTWTPQASTDLVIGYYRNDAIDSIADAYIFKDPVPINEIVVSARKILANAIVSQHITAGEILTTHMQAGSINADRLMTNTMDAQVITTSTLSADLTLSGSIKTSLAGARVEMDNLGIRGYDTGGSETINIDATDGSVTIEGGVQAGGDIEGATITGGIIQTNNTPTTDGIIIDDANGIRAFQSSTLNTHITRLGVATLKKVTINGTASDVLFSVGSGASIFKVDTNGLYLGSSTYATAPFRVAYDGTAILTKAVLTGAGLAANGKIIDTTGFSVDKEGDVTASSMTITNGTISGGTIDIGGADSTSFHIDSTGQMWLGASTYSSAPFRVSNTGALDIGGVDSTSFHVDNAGNMWSGNATFSTAPFKVSNTGAVTATNVSISGSTGNIINTTNFVVTGAGAITADSGVFNSGTINGTFTVNGALDVNGGSITLTSGDMNLSGSGDINVSSGDIIVSSSGLVKSSNFNTSTETGWSMSASGVEIYDGAIVADALRIGVSNTNLFQNASFEDGTTTATGWNVYAQGGGIATHTVVATESLYQSKSQKIEVTTAGSRLGVWQDVEFNEPLLPGESITVSLWVKQTAGVARDGKMWFFPYGSGSGTLQNTYASTLVVGTWVRLVDTYTATSTINDGVRIYLCASPGEVGDIFYFDGAQLQRGDFVTDFQPAPLDIPENYIQSAMIGNLSADRITSGIISANTITIGSTGYIQSTDWDGVGAGYRLSASGATFQNGAVSIVGSGGAVTLNSTELRANYGGNDTFLASATGVKLAGSIDVNQYGIQSSNWDGVNTTTPFVDRFNASTLGWQITNAGDAGFNNLFVRNSIFKGGNEVGTGGGSSSDYMQSTNYIAGVSGWKIDGAGNFEGNSGTFRGNLVSATFTGGLIRTAASGLRLEIDSAVSVNSIRLQTGIGSQTAPGSIKHEVIYQTPPSTNPYNRITIAPAEFGSGAPKMQLNGRWSGGQSTLHMDADQIAIDALGTVLNLSAAVAMNINEYTGAPVKIASATKTSSTSNLYVQNGRIGARQSSTNYVAFGHESYGPASSTAYGFAQANNGQAFLSGTDTFIRRRDASSHEILLWNLSGTNRTSIGATSVDFPGLFTGAASSDAHFVSGLGINDRLFRVTSTIDFKKEVEEASFDTAKIYNLELRKWKSKVSWDDTYGGIDDPSKEYFGLVAEEAAAVDPEFATADLSTGKVNGINQYTLVYAILGEVQKLRNELNELKGLPKIQRTKIRPKTHVPLSEAMEYVLALEELRPAEEKAEREELRRLHEELKKEAEREGRRKVPEELKFENRDKNWKKF